jgi:hypothetical protein
VCTATPRGDRYVDLLIREVLDVWRATERAIEQTDDDTEREFLHQRIGELHALYAGLTDGSQPADGDQHASARQAIERAWTAIRAVTPEGS